MTVIDESGLHARPAARFVQAASRFASRIVIRTGDREADAYHVGYRGYRWLLDRTQPPLWLHGHVPPASVEGWRVPADGTEVVNVTGAVLVDFVPPADDPEEPS